MANRPKRSGLCLLAGLAVLLQCEIHPASAREIDILAGLERLISPKQEVDKRAANANALVSREASSGIESGATVDPKARIGISKGPVLRRFQSQNGGELGTCFRLVREDKRASR